MTYVEAIIKVLIVGLILGAGLPAVFAAGLVAYSNGAGGTHEDGTVVNPNPALKYFGILVFIAVGWVIITAVAWIARAAIIHHIGFDPFPFIKK
ncbi:hypothetical protein A5662_04925 [Mycobacteriaceae bacterium 1482268.1]|nr:hypothetical protein A5662_04925 [Mycobacteriaceae bacterium 1482268.1]